MQDSYYRLNKCVLYSTIYLVYNVRSTLLVKCKHIIIHFNNKFNLLTTGNLRLGDRTYISTTMAAK